MEFGFLAQNRIHAALFGVVSGGEVDNTDAIQTALNSVPLIDNSGNGNIGGRVVTLPPGKQEANAEK